MTSGSNGVSISMDRGVMTIWTSLRKSVGNSGRIWRSVRRAVRMPCVLGRPSRRKKLPGILPREYRRSSTSMVRGKKSMPSRGLDIVAATSRAQSPCLTSTAPFACRASCPVSIIRVPDS